MSSVATLPQGSRPSAHPHLPTRRAVGGDRSVRSVRSSDALFFAREVERVFNIECRQKGGDGTYPLMADVDAGFVLARENATLAELRTVVTAAGAELSDEDPSCAFLGAGEWSWALHDGKSKVRPSQEGTLRAFEHVPGLCVLGGAGSVLKCSTP